MRILRELTALVAGVLALLLASATSASLTGADTSTAVTLAVLAVALGVLLQSGAGRVLLAGHATVRARGAARSRPPLRVGPATDPVHHPLRPRAPGGC